MESLLYAIHVIVCLAMLPVILLQAGKGGGVNAGFGGGGASVFGGSSGASTFLIKLTTGAAILFMCTSMGLSYMSSRSRSVIGDTPAAAAPATPPTAGAAAPTSTTP